MRMERIKTRTGTRITVGEGESVLQTRGWRQIAFHGKHGCREMQRRLACCTGRDRWLPTGPRLSTTSGRLQTAACAVRRTAAAKNTVSGGVPVRHGAAWRFCRPLARRGRRGSSRAVPGESRAAGRMFPVKRRYSGRRKEVAVPSSGPETASRSSVVVLVMRSRLVHRPLVAPCTGCTAMVGAWPLPAGDEGDRTTQVPCGTAAHDRSGETRAGCRRRASTKIPALDGGEPRVRSGRGIGSG